MRVLRLPRNDAGRVFVIGDVHGAYDLVWQGMKAVKFDPACDLLLSVGDLIDRGAGSSRCLAFLDQPYVHAIAGNHERMLVDAWRQGLNGATVRALARMDFNGMGWLKDVPLETIAEIAERFSTLPFVMEVETSRGTVGLVHADVPAGMRWPDFVERVEAGDEHCIDIATGMVDQSRDRVLEQREDGVPGIGRVFVGHTPQFDGLKRLANVFAIDTGACYPGLGKSHGHLTMVETRMATAYLATPAPRPNPLLDIRAFGEVPEARFSGIARSPSRR